MRTDWLVIADDLTGAAEIAGIAHGRGLSVRILSGEQPPAESCEVLVINTDTRDRTGKEAAATIRRLVPGLGDLGGLKLYKKTDSLLRGPVAEELIALLDCTAYSTALLVPANPSKGRQIRAGRYMIGAKALDESEHRTDPDHPRTSSDIRTLLGIGPGGLLLRKDVGEALLNKIQVPDHCSPADITALAQDNHTSGKLLAGGADFFRELLLSQLRPKRQQSREVLTYPDNRCFVFGSYARANRSALEKLKQCGYEILELEVREGGDPKTGSDVLKKLSHLGAAPGRKVLKLPDDHIEDPAIRNELLMELTSVACTMPAALERPWHFLVTGGKTASHFCNKMGWDQFIVRESHEEGVVTLSPGNTEHLITIKPGSYHWPDELLS